jgi:hypothetical protein
MNTSARIHQRSQGDLWRRKIVIPFIAKTWGLDVSALLAGPQQSAGSVGADSDNGGYAGTGLFAFRGIITPSSPEDPPDFTSFLDLFDNPTLLAQNLPLGMNGAWQAARQAAKGVPKTSPPPKVTPGNEPPPQWPEDFQSDFAKLVGAAIKAFFDSLPDLISVADPCFTDPNIPCGGQGPPQL